MPNGAAAGKKSARNSKYYGDISPFYELLVYLQPVYAGKINLIKTL